MELNGISLTISPIVISAGAVGSLSGVANTVSTILTLPFPGPGAPAAPPIVPMPVCLIAWKQSMQCRSTITRVATLDLAVGVEK